MKIGFDKVNLNVEEEKNKDKFECSSSLATKIVDKKLTDLENIDLLMKNRKCMSDEEFISVLSSYACFKLDEKDAARVCSLMNDKKYTCFDLMSSTMRYGNEFVDFAFVGEEDFSFDRDHNYTPSEIYDLIGWDKIVLLNEDKTGIWSFRDEETRNDSYQEIYTHKVPVHSYSYPGFDNLKAYYNGSSLEYRIALYKYMRSHIKKYMLEREISSTVCDFYDGLSDISKLGNDSEYYNMVNGKLRDINTDRRVSKLVRKYN